MKTLQDNILITIGSLVLIPHPNDDDTWKSEIITTVTDIDVDGLICFSDDDWDKHKIESDRVRLV